MKTLVRQIFATRMLTINNLSLELSRERVKIAIIHF